MRRLIEGRFLSSILGGVLRLPEVALGTLIVVLRTLRRAIVSGVGSKIDRPLSAIGKRAVAKRATVEPGAVMLLTERGDFGGDVKYVAEELLRRGVAPRLTWAVTDTSVGPFPEGLELVRRGSAEFFSALAQAGIVVQDGPVAEQSGAHLSASQRVLRCDAGELAGLGHPRTDVLFGASSAARAELRRRVLSELGVHDEGQRFMCFELAPSDDRVTGAMSGVDVLGLRAALAERFGGNWEILIRTGQHTRREAFAMLAGLPSFCRDASLHPDVYELLEISDAAMTDRAHWAADAVLAGKPALFYSTNRSASGGAVTADLAGARLSVATTNRELMESIAQFDEAALRAAADTLASGEARATDGEAAVRTVDALERLTGCAP